MIKCGKCRRLPYCRNSTIEDKEECNEYLEMTEQQQIQRIRHSTHYKKRDE